MNKQTIRLPIRRNRLVYAILTISVMLAGVASRHFFGESVFVRTYVGDMLWALMVFLGFAVAFNQWSAKTCAQAAFLFSFGIELSQLYHAPWIDTLRSSWLGGLILGFSFLWSDLVCYSIGILIGLLVDCYALPSRFRLGASQQTNGGRAVS